MKHRLQKLRDWKEDALGLQADNDRIFGNLDSRCAAVLKEKHLALFEKLAADMNWPDVDLHNEVRQGFKLVGMQPPSGVFSSDIKPRSLSSCELDKQMKYLNPALWEKPKAGKTADFEDELWNMTMDEVIEKRWLDGPYNKEELDTLFDDAWLPVRRFAVWQRSKWRPIDDFTECGVNSSFAYSEKVDLKALDETVWIANCFVKLCLRESHFNFRLRDDGELEGEVHPFWKTAKGDSTQLVAKTVDLRSAYKQLAICPSNRKYSALALRKPGAKQVFGFVSKTLPFGSVASVLHFNRVARLLHRPGLELNVAWCNYYDDFPVIDFKVLADHMTSAIRAMTSLLGFECSLDEEQPFDKTAEMLGVVLVLRDSMEGK